MGVIIYNGQHWLLSDGRIISLLMTRQRLSRAKRIGRCMSIYIDKLYGLIAKEYDLLC